MRNAMNKMMNELIIPMFKTPNKFYPEEIEKEFIEDYARKFSNSRKASMFLGFSVWSFYYLWDVYHGVQSEWFRPYLPYILTLRTIGFAYLFYALIMCIREESLSERRAVYLLSSSILVAYFLLLTMVLVSPFPYNYLFYFVGLPLVLAFMFSLPRFRAKTTHLLVIIQIAASCFMLPFAVKSGQFDGYGSIVSYYYVAAITYLISFAIIGGAVSVELEQTARRAFARERNMTKSSIDLEEKNRELKRLNEDTNLKTEALVTLKDELKAVAEQRAAAASKFMADAAHDLRQPMQALANLLEAACQNLDLGNIDKCRSLLSIAQEAADVSRVSFDSILDITKLDTGFVRPEYSIVEVHEIIQQVLSTYIIFGREQGVRFRIRRSIKQNVYTKTDVNLLQRAISNVISNSIKYKDSKKHRKSFVHIGIISLKNRVRIDITDNGIGIPQISWSEIFKPFVQLDNPERDRERGQGLGLSIVDATMRILLEHRVEMKSKEKVGTRFSFELPLVELDESKTNPVKVNLQHYTMDISGTYIIYIEDDRVIRDSLIEILNLHDVLVESFKSYEDFCQSMSEIERLPDIIITDNRLPNNKTGLDVIEKARILFDSQIPAIILTGDIVGVVQEMTMRNVNVMRKPATPQAILTQVLDMLYLERGEA